MNFRGSEENILMGSNIPYCFDEERKEKNGPIFMKLGLERRISREGIWVGPHFNR
jgi:hypothetical protein